MKKTLKVGLVGSSQLSFPGDKESVYASTAAAIEALGREWGFDTYIYPEQVIAADDARKAVQALEGEKVDFVLLQCTSFSAGFLAPVFARIRNAYLGLWAIPEDYHQGGCKPFTFGLRSV